MTPMTPRSADDWLAEAKRFRDDVELFRAYDVARRGLKQHPDDPRLKHLAVLCLASSGATQQADEAYDKFELATQRARPLQLAIDIKCLPPRLAKDRALALNGTARRSALAQAGDLYEAVYRGYKGKPGAYYPAINAATLRLLAGDRRAAARLAGAVLKLLTRRADGADYWETATKIEALLVLGRSGQARALMTKARDRIDPNKVGDLRALAATLRQLQLIVRATGLPADWLDHIRADRVVHYLGHIIGAPGAGGRFPAEQEPRIRARIEKHLDAAPVSFAYGSLAAGADILFAEALLERGAKLNVVLPFDRDDFIERSVRPAGEDWVTRFRRCAAEAETVRFATEGKGHQNDRLFTYGSQIAMGFAVLRAQHISTKVEQLAVYDGRPAIGQVGTAHEISLWRRTGRKPHIIRCGNRSRAVHSASQPGGGDGGRHPRAMLFADVKGYSKLTDVEVPVFFKLVLGAFARVLKRYGDKVLHKNTWGDALYLVFDDAGLAARCALDLQAEMATIDRAAVGLPEEMGLRIGGHLGPTYAGVDPVINKAAFFGAHVSRAARIEPVTPVGSIYVTEAFAAILALHNADEFACDYVGVTKAAKRYKAMRMFALRQREPNQGRARGKKNRRA
jgi:hypothetical protein